MVIFIKIRMSLIVIGLKNSFICEVVIEQFIIGQFVIGQFNKPITFKVVVKSTKIIHCSWFVQLNQMRIQQVQFIETQIQHPYWSCGLLLSVIYELAFARVNSLIPLLGFYQRFSIPVRLLRIFTLKLQTCLFYACCASQTPSWCIAFPSTPF